MRTPASSPHPYFLAEVPAPRFVLPDLATKKGRSLTSSWDKTYVRAMVILPWPLFLFGAIVGPQLLSSYPDRRHIVSFHHALTNIRRHPRSLASAILILDPWVVLHIPLPLIDKSSVPPRATRPTSVTAANAQSTYQAFKRTKTDETDRDLAQRAEMATEAGVTVPTSEHKTTV